MKFRKFKIPKPHPWEYPSRYPYIILEGPGKPLSENEQRQIKAKRESWRPSKIANNIKELLKSSIGKTIQLQLENPENYYDTPDERPESFLAELKGVVAERVLDLDMEFDQLFILLSNPRHLNGESIFKKYDYDYDTLLKPQNNEGYTINFRAVAEFSVEQMSFWKQLLKKKNSI